jgi:excisionase family DNA binding protein
VNTAGKPNGEAGTLLTLPLLAEMAGVSVVTLRREIAAGRLPAVKVGRLLRVRLTDWESYLSSKRVVGRPEPVPERLARPRAAAAPGLRPA